MEDEVIRYNRTRWTALVDAAAVFTQPRLDLTPTTARAYLDPNGHLGDLQGRTVCCLAAAGGQQGPAFALLGATVTVVDLVPEQLAHDTAAARHYGVPLQTLVADMRDLQALPADHFDLVWHAYALNFVPEVAPVFREVARLVRAGGNYHFRVANPFALGVQATDWDGTGYPLRHPYLPGAWVSTADPDWVSTRESGSRCLIPPPREYRHTLSQLVMGLVTAGFTITHLEDQVDVPADPGAAPGTWAHFTSVLPPWFAVTARRAT